MAIQCEAYRTRVTCELTAFCSDKENNKLNKKTFFLRILNHVLFPPLRGRAMRKEKATPVSKETEDERKRKRSEIFFCFFFCCFS